MFRIQEETVYEPTSEFLKWIENEKLKTYLQNYTKDLRKGIER